jgi:hypothetical protein
MEGESQKSREDLEEGRFEGTEETAKEGKAVA